MIAEPQDSTQPPNDGALKSASDWVAKHWARVRLGHEGFMLDKIQRQSRIVEVTARNAMTGESANTDGLPGHEGNDAMGVNIGDHIHYHESPPQAEPPQAEPPQPAPAPSLLSKTLPYVLAAAIGAGGTLGAAKLGGLFDRPDPASVVDTDTTRRIEIEKYIPE